MTTQVYSSHQQTRQQLEELDALLQRMLSLPVHSPETGKANAEPMRPELFAPLPPTLPHTSAATRAAPPVGSAPAVQAWRKTSPASATEPPMAIAIEAPELFQPSTQAPYPYSLVFGQPLPAEASPPPVETRATAPLPEAPAAPTAVRAVPEWAVPLAAEEEASAAASLFLFPFVALNRLFDVVSYLLGPLGTWLRRPSGRNSLGWLGVVMILGAAGWAFVEWHGVDWTR